MRCSQPLAIRGLLSAALITQLGCGSSTVSLKHQHFKYREDVAQVYVGVQSVAPFEDYVDALQPRFDFTPAAALDAAIAQTQISDIRRLQALAASLKAALPQTGVTRSDVTTTQDGATSSSSTTTTSKKPGMLDNAPAYPAVVGSLPDALVLPTNISPQFAAVLRYREATADYQEVSLLSRYVRDAAVARNETPYVVRFLVSVFPAARFSPYDAYVQVSFKHAVDSTMGPVLRGDSYSRLKAYSDLYNEVTKKAEYKTNPAFKAHADTLEIYSKGLIEVDKAIATAATAIKTAGQLAPDCDKQPARVIPLFVTDTFESSLDSTALLGSRDLGLSLGGTVSGVALGAGLSDRLEDERRSLNRGLNGLYTLGSSAPDRLDVRLGAAYAGDLYVMVPRTYSLTALVLARSTEKEFESSTATAIVPCNSMSFNTSIEFYDADKGQKTEHDPSRTMGNPGSFPLPEAQSMFQRPLLYGSVQDDSKVTKLSISGGVGLAVETSSASLKVPPAGSFPALSLTQTNATVNTARTSITFEFPSVRTLRLCDKGKTAKDAKDGKLALAAGKVGGKKDQEVTAEVPLADPGPDPCAVQYSVDTDIQATHFNWSRLRMPRWVTANVDYVRMVADPPPTPQFQLAIPAGRILAAAEGTGSLQVLLRSESTVPVVALSVDGGEIIGIEGQKLTGSDWTVSAPGAFNLSLRNLLPDTSITLRAWQMVGGKRVDSPPQTAIVVLQTPKATKPATTTSGGS